MVSSSSFRCYTLKYLFLPQLIHCIYILLISLIVCFSIFLYSFCFVYNMSSIPIFLVCNNFLYSPHTSINTRSFSKFLPKSFKARESLSNCWNDAILVNFPLRPKLNVHSFFCKILIDGDDLYLTGNFSFYP